MSYLSICFISFVFLMGVRLTTLNLGIYCLFNEIAYFFEIELLSINSSIIVITLLID